MNSESRVVAVEFCLVKNYTYQGDFAEVAKTLGISEDDLAAILKGVMDFPAMSAELQETLISVASIETEDCDIEDILEPGADSWAEVE